MITPDPLAHWLVNEEWGYFIPVALAELREAEAVITEDNGETEG